jgi:hypothetical protein
MPVDVGDAILTFIGDTTQLDQAFDSVGAQAETKLAPVNAQLTEVSSNWDPRRYLCPHSGRRSHYGRHRDGRGRSPNGARDA